MKKQHFGIFNAHGKREAAVDDMNSPFLFDGESLSWVAFQQIDKTTNWILTNLAMGEKTNKPLVACSYTLPFNSQGDVWILVWRDDLRNIDKILTNSQTRDIYRYNYETWEVERGLEGLFERKDITNNRDLENSDKTKEQIIAELQKTNKYWICKLIGGKDEFDDPVLELVNTLHQKEHLEEYEKILLKEFEEETVRRGLQKIVYFGKTIELKNEFTKVGRTSVSLINEEFEATPMSKQKISEWELSQDLCSVYMPLHIAVMISQQAIATTLSHKSKPYRTKLSSNSRTFTLLKYAMTHRKKIEKALGISIN